MSAGIFLETKMDICYYYTVAVKSDIGEISMSIKEILKLYFDTYVEWYNKEYGSLPKTKYSEKIWSHLLQEKNL